MAGRFHGGGGCSSIIDELLGCSTFIMGCWAAFLLANCLLKRLDVGIRSRPACKAASDADIGLCVTLGDGMPGGLRPGTITEGGSTTWLPISLVADRELLEVTGPSFMRLPLRMFATTGTLNPRFCSCLCLVKAAIVCSTGELMMAGVNSHSLSALSSSLSTMGPWQTV